MWPASSTIQGFSASTHAVVQLMLLKQRTEEEYKMGLERVVDDIERLELLIAQMLQLARVEETSQRDAPLIDLGATAGKIAALLTPIAEQHAVCLDVQVPAGVQIR